MEPVIPDIMAFKLSSGHTVIGQLIETKWSKIKVERPFSIERRMDSSGAVAEVLTAYMPYAQDNHVWLNRSSIITIYQVNDVFSRFYWVTLQNYLTNLIHSTNETIEEYISEMDEQGTMNIPGTHPGSNTVQ